MTAPTPNPALARLRVRLEDGRFGKEVSADLRWLLTEYTAQQAEITPSQGGGDG